MRIQALKLSLPSVDTVRCMAAASKPNGVCNYCAPPRGGMRKIASQLTLHR